MGSIPTGGAYSRALLVFFKEGPVSMTEIKSHGLSPIWRSSEETRFVISSSSKRVSLRKNFWQPPTDVYETEQSIVVQVEIAGMHDSEFTISLDNRTLSISGVRQGPGEQGAYYQMEIPAGEFLSMIKLPSAVDYDKVEAVYKDGFLRVVLPKAKPDQIEVKK